MFRDTLWNRTVCSFIYLFLKIIIIIIIFLITPNIYQNAFKSLKI